MVNPMMAAQKIAAGASAPNKVNTMHKTKVLKTANNPAQTRPGGQSFKKKRHSQCSEASVSSWNGCRRRRAIGNKGHTEVAPIITGQ
jgi:hypothetical protein